MADLFRTTHPFAPLVSGSLFRTACLSPSIRVMIASGAAAFEGVASGFSIPAALDDSAALEGPHTMPVTLHCTGCKSTLKVRDDLVGKKIKCPKCATLLLVAAEKEEELAPVDVDPDESGEAPARKSRSRRDDDEEEDRDRRRDRDRDDDRRQAIRTDRDRDRDRRRRDDDEEEDDDRDRKRRRDRDDADEDYEERVVKKSKFKRCPRCEAPNPKKVKWTAWGSFYGPAMFSHVQCQECGYCYNGKTGGSNLIPAIIFVTVPLLGILGIIGAIFYVIFSRGWMGGQ
jgi:hypothetical protein